MSNTFNRWLMLPHVRVQNANAISSPLTAGFPSMTAFFGMMWALERRCVAEGIKIGFQAVGVIVHDTQLLMQNEVFNQMRVPAGKDGKPASMQEEGRMHMDVTFLFGVSLSEGGDAKELAHLAGKIMDILQTMRVAGGTVLSPILEPSQTLKPTLGTKSDFPKVWQKKYRFQLMPGYALVEDAALIDERLEELQVQHPAEKNLTPFDAWLSLCGTTWRAPVDGLTGMPTKGKWPLVRKTKRTGRVVPIPVGYGSLAPLNAPGTVSDTRDSTTPFQAVESLYSIGRWVPVFLEPDPMKILWVVKNQLDEGVYRVEMLDPSAPNPAEVSTSGEETELQNNVYAAAYDEDE